jgi:hypothetical protein
MPGGAVFVGFPGRIGTQPITLKSIATPGQA